MPGPISTKNLPMSEQLGVILSRIDDLRTDVYELKQEVKRQGQTLTEKELTQAKLNVRFDHSSLDSEQRLDKHDMELAEIRKVLPQLIVLAKWIGVLFGLLGASVFAMLWAIFTHQITIIFP